MGNHLELRENYADFIKKHAQEVHMTPNGINTSLLEKEILQHKNKMQQHHVHMP